MKEKRPRISKIHVHTAGIFPEFNDEEYNSRKEFLRDITDYHLFYTKSIRILCSYGTKFTMEYELLQKDHNWILYRNNVQQDASFGSLQGFIKELSQKFL